MWLNDFYQTLNPIALQIGPFIIRWYALAYIAGFISAGIVMYKTSQAWKIPLGIDRVMGLVNASIIGVIVGARLVYVLFYGFSYYSEHPLEVFFLNQGGMSFHGGLVGALIAGYIMCRFVYKISFVTVCDLAVIGTCLGLFFGRCANFINGELWGKACDLPWGVMFAHTGGGFVYRHPSQLYEAVLEGLVIFTVLFTLAHSKKRSYEGEFIGIFLVLYGTFRFLVEFVRLPDAQLGYLCGTDWLTMGQCLSLPLIVLGVLVLFWSRTRKIEHHLS